MTLETRYGLLLGALGAAIGILISGAISVDAIATLASAVWISSSDNPLFALFGLACASLGSFVAARRLYACGQQRRRYLSLTVGVLALIVVPSSFLRVFDVAPLHHVPIWIAGSVGILALGLIVFVAVLPLLMRPVLPDIKR
jgi:hypothetical protein